MWNVCIKEDLFINVERIFPAQQKEVAALVKGWKENSNVKKIIIFGSSVRESCNPWSDLDVYVELEREELLKIPKGVEDPVDQLSNFIVDKRLMKEIEETGVVVWEKER